MISQKNTIRQINKRILYNKELYEYAIRNHYLSGANPFMNMFVGDKATVEEGTEHYDKFTLDELGRIFDPAKCSDFFRKPDYIYGPYLSLYSGAQLEEFAIFVLKISRRRGRHILRYQENQELYSENPSSQEYSEFVVHGVLGAIAQKEM